MINKTKMPAATINMFVQMLVPPPKYTIQKLVPGVKLTDQSNLAGMFIIERSNRNGISPIENSEAMDVLMKNCEDAYGFPPYDKLKEFLCCNTEIDLPEKERNIIRQAFSSVPTTVIQSDHYDWWTRMLPNIDEELINDLDCIEAAPSLVYQLEAV